MRRLTRAEFLRAGAVSGAVALSGAGAVTFAACGGSSGEAPAARNATPQVIARRKDRPATPTLAIASGPSPADNTARAVAAAGGMAAYVHSGDVVVVKPNMVTGRAPEYAATTNPEVVATLVRLARDAGAKRVLVMDNPTSDARSAYSLSGIADAADAAGAEVHFMTDAGYRDYVIPGSLLGTHPLYSPAVDADVLITVPIAKQHGSATLTLAGKNLMGICNKRSRLHTKGLSRGIAELAAAFVPDLAVIDATRILVRNGPNGGNLDDVVAKNTVVACADWVAADAWVTRLFGLTPQDVPYLTAAADMNLGTIDLRSQPIKHV